MFFVYLFLTPALRYHLSTRRARGIIIYVLRFTTSQQQTIITPNHGVLYLPTILRRLIAITKARSLIIIIVVGAWFCDNVRPEPTSTRIYFIHAHTPSPGGKFRGVRVFWKNYRTRVITEFPLPKLNALRVVFLKFHRVQLLLSRAPNDLDDLPRGTRVVEVKRSNDWTSVKYC